VWLVDTAGPPGRSTPRMMENGADPRCAHPMKCCLVVTMIARSGQTHPRPSRPGGAHRRVLTKLDATAVACRLDPPGERAPRSSSIAPAEKWRPLPAFHPSAWPKPDLGMGCSPGGEKPARGGTGRCERKDAAKLQKPPSTSRFVQARSDDQTMLPVPNEDRPRMKDRRPASPTGRSQPKRKSKPIARRPSRAQATPVPRRPNLQAPAQCPRMPPPPSDQGASPISEKRG